MRPEDFYIPEGPEEVAPMRASVLRTVVLIRREDAPAVVEGKIYHRGEERARAIEKLRHKR